MRRVRAEMAGLMVLGAALCALAGCTARAPFPVAEAAAQTPRQCFSPSSVNNYAEVGEEALNLRVGVNEIWRLELEGSCPGLQWAHNRIVLAQRYGGGSICNGGAADVLISDRGFPRRCSVEQVVKLTQAEIDALPDREKP